MSNGLNRFTTEQLEEEINARKSMKKPEPIKNPDFSKLVDVCVDYINDIENGEVNDDIEEWLYEETMTVVFGENVFDWINRKV